MRDATLGVQVIAVGNLTVEYGQNSCGRKICSRTPGCWQEWPFFRVGISKPGHHERLLNKLLLTGYHSAESGFLIATLLLDSESSGDEPYMLLTCARCSGAGR